MPDTERDQQLGTEGVDYTDRLQRVTTKWWKRLLPVQLPYRLHIRRLRLGRTLDVGCGLGRNLVHLGGNGVGVDHNPTSIAVARAQGLEAYTTDEFFGTERAETFDSMLAAHLLEHLPEADARKVVEDYLPCVKPGGTAVFITPQERGYASDETHVRFVGFDEAAQLCRDLGLTVVKQYSFPFPRFMGKAFTYNEFVTVARRP